ncbi:hypothetical protein SKA58_14747 [Sphingomonas sp. SKA58]|nr:hypothetical protein SKA58_14747 [Sphingomonas sp. SKA58]
MFSPMTDFERAAETINLIALLFRSKGVVG